MSRPPKLDSEYCLLTCSLSSSKRPASPFGPSSLPPSKSAKPIPIAPRGSNISGAPTGPRSLSGFRSSATGPQSIQVAAYSTATQTRKSQSPHRSISDDGKARSPHSASPRRSQSPPVQFGMRGNSRGPSRGGSHGRGGSRPPGGHRKQFKAPQVKQSKPVREVEGPVNDEAYIMATYGSAVSVRDAWRDNPKTYFGNFVGSSLPKPTRELIQIGDQRLHRSVGDRPGTKYLCSCAGRRSTWPILWL